MLYDVIPSDDFRRLPINSDDTRRFPTITRASFYDISDFLSITPLHQSEGC